MSDTRPACAVGVEISALRSILSVLSSACANDCLSLGSEPPMSVEMMTRGLPITLLPLSYGTCTDRWGVVCLSSTFAEAAADGADQRLDDVVEERALGGHDHDLGRHAGLERDEGRDLAHVLGRQLDARQVIGLVGVRIEDA